MCSMRASYIFYYNGLTSVISYTGFRNSLLKALTDFQKNKEGGVFINSCFIHCQTWMAETWHGPNSPKINNKVSKVLLSTLW